jgi:predicted ATP-grasp superfamily ATP-dependent carboligase
MYDVLMTGAETRQGVVVIRALAEHGVRMFVTGHERHSAGFYSRYIAGKAQLPSPVQDKAAFVDAVIEQVRRHRIPYVFPVTETTLLPLDERRGELEKHAKLLAPASEVIRSGMDKKIQMEICERLGIPIARTIHPTSIEEALAFAERVGYPVVFKPRGRAAESEQKLAVDFKVEYCHDAQHVRRFMQQFAPGVYPMLQDFAHGTHIQVHCFVERGIAHSPFMDVAPRTLPLTGGVGARRTSCEIVPELWEHSQRFFRELGWEGVAQVQWKGPGRDGKYRYMEVSVRIVASIGSLVHSGVNLPWMHYQYFTGQPVDRVTRYKVNNPTQWLRGDTVAVVRHLLGDQPVSGDALPSKSAVLRSYLSDFFRPGLRRDVESWRDPLPALPEFAHLCADLGHVLRRSAAAHVPGLRRLRGSSAD